MYRNLDECLSQVYRLASVNITPMGNTGAVINHLQGVSGGGSGLTQAEWHANAAMIESQISGCLKSKLLVSVIECQYGKYDNLMYIADVIVASGRCDDYVDVTSFVEIKYLPRNLVNPILAADLLRHIYTDHKQPREVDILNSHDLARSTFYRMREKLRAALAQWESEARFKLQTEFTQKGIIGT